MSFFEIEKESVKKGKRELNKIEKENWLPAKLKAEFLAKSKGKRNFPKI